MSELFKVSFTDGIGTVFMNHLPVNSITDRFASELMALLQRISNDKSVRVVVITSSIESIFMAGADIKMMREAVKSKDFRRLRVASVIKPAFTAIQDMPQPVIAAINGHALGGGCELALACDYRIIAKGKRIGLTEVLLGLIPGAGGTQRIIRMLPRPIATRMLLEGVQLDADEALAVGLVDRVAEGDKLLNEARKFAERFARGPSRTYAALKKCMNKGRDMDLASGLKLEEEVFFDLIENSVDSKEGLTAFLEKRAPVFTGE